MATSVFRRQLLLCCRHSRTNTRQLTRQVNIKKTLTPSAALGATVTGVLAWKIWQARQETAEILPVVTAKSEGEDGNKEPRIPHTYREVRYRQFASVEYKGITYMTPQDFLESVTEEMPRPRIGRAKLKDKEVEYLLKNTPTRSKGSNKLFRKLHNQGLISYTEYLFLLCVLTKPQSGFRIAFNMFDTDGNQIVDKKEFLVLESFFTLPPAERKFVPRPQQKLQALLDLERVFSKEHTEAGSEQINRDHTVAKSVDPVQDTTLLIHFFGPKGKQALKYEDFHRFMENLQSEVIELEFVEFSKGMATITEEDFAHILLRYTMFDKTDVQACITRVKERIPAVQGITFEEFKQFCQFLNSLDDFTIAMKMYTFADQAVSKEQFQRAVYVCTGNTLSPHLVNTVFQIFDADGDGHLSHKEFISIMKDRLHRGSRKWKKYYLASHLMHTQDNWSSFKSCVKNEMRSY
ncbi:calcium uptake protein 3, mitochondrial-like isoform X4 [Pecten maximus]|uniref:calcium uptake protein 3, mitochondrial-like isoform X3 n=1 Tax=Pecten maximus TaxID=6579 RepID=UPI0014580107|nr:calcium uptake protein 3, mitochondrial-like isoform X3 [Pecten maximus]XP_033743593.1 calcium uptake protein 3, mitochondrial-like isoform X4 [Pecten maximus]